MVYIYIYLYDQFERETFEPVNIVEYIQRQHLKSMSLRRHETIICVIKFSPQITQHVKTA
jgi:hypothetical protein